MKLIVSKDYAEMCQKVARLFAAQITLKPASVLGLATGSTPVGMYAELVTKYKEGRLDFSAVRTVNLDEYVGLTGDNDQSYRYFMNHNLFDLVNIDKANTHVPNGMAADPAAECAAYDQVVESMGGVDIQLLGIGNNGHIGFNEPCGHFPVDTHLVDLTESTITANARFFATMDEVPRQALTMGIGTIMKAKKVVLMASGKAKAQIIRDTMFGPVTPNVPASVLQLHPDALVFVDEEAYSVIAAEK
ncbi:MAG: glucosamine-6-phosphate deaminase [Oscillospiraceae bacterium]|jgi:glucosamine-6-phosphate deaminase|nr:glucosamine-6-phosphate deaminase [Oscillospiraceae bacterium]